MTNGPLNESHLQGIKSMLQRCREGKEEVQRAARAGLDVEEYRKQLDEQEKQLLQIKSTYFPGQ